VTEPIPSRPEHVPDHVLEELLGAFAEESAPQYNFDDPSIDRILGITDEHDIAGVEEPELERTARALEEAADELIGDDLEVVELDPDLDHAVPPDAPATKAATDSRPSPRRTIVIAEDDRPDSVYLDIEKEKGFHARRESVDESGERSTIVIADIDEPGSSGPPLASSRGAGIDPRIRARRISVRRAESRRRLVWVAIGVVVVLLAIAAIAIVASPIFDVRVVNVQGATYTDADVLSGVIDDLQGEPVLLVDTKAAEEALEAVPWVESARVSTEFPHTVLIDIRERRAVATFQSGDGRFRVIDEQGRVLDVIDNRPVDYTLIVGANPDSVRGQFAGGVYASAARLITGLPAEISAIVQSIGVDASTGTLTMALTGTANDSVVAVRLGDDKGLDEKLARLLLQIRSGLDGVCGLDVSTGDAGVVYC
jgi:cell division protein FtsQ